jgi:hypothetical protein
MPEQSPDYVEAAPGGAVERARARSDIVLAATLFLVPHGPFATSFLLGLHGRWFELHFDYQVNNFGVVVDRLVISPMPLELSRDIADEVA